MFELTGMIALITGAARGQVDSVPYPMGTRSDLDATGHCRHL